MVMLFLYPIWGFALLLLFCTRLRFYGSFVRRATASLLVASFATALFTPVMWGTEGFAMMAPWPTILLEPKHSEFVWELAAFVFAFALLISLFSGRTRANSGP